MKNAKKFLNQNKAIVACIVVTALKNALPFKKKTNVVNHLKKYLTISIIFILLVIRKTSFAQLHPILDRFDVFDANGKIYISCVISSGSTCNGIDVLRSEDSINFISVGHIGGVCGSSSAPVTYNFIDENPIKNKPIYYKLELGGQGYTNIISIQIMDTKEFGFQIRPNPANENAIIYFQNKNNIEHTINVTNLSGVIVLSQTTIQNFFFLDLYNLPAGIYPFSISGSHYDKGVLGKLVIIH